MKKGIEEGINQVINIIEEKISETPAMTRCSQCLGLLVAQIRLGTWQKK